MSVQPAALPIGYDGAALTDAERVELRRARAEERRSRRSLARQPGRTIAGPVNMSTGLAAGWFAGRVGDAVEALDGESGTVAKVTPTWVLVDSAWGDRWVHRDRFESGEWWLS